MATLKLSPGSANTPELQKIYNEMHRLFMLTKISHYDTKSFAAHKALDETFEAIEELVDSLVEQLVGYTGTVPNGLAIGTVSIVTPAELASQIMRYGADLQKFAEANSYPNIENLAQEFSGVGARLKYLSRFP